MSIGMGLIQNWEARHLKAHKAVAVHSDDSPVRSYSSALVAIVQEVDRNSAEAASLVPEEISNRWRQLVGDSGMEIAADYANSFAVVSERGKSCFLLVAVAEDMVAGDRIVDHMVVGRTEAAEGDTAVVVGS
jgi:hypothetical protein